MGQSGAPADIYRIRRRLQRSLEALLPLIEGTHKVDGASKAVRPYRVLVAVSGGADSVVLLHALSELGPAIGLSPFVAHVDHGLREQSGDDARYVEQLAATLGVPCLLREAPNRPQSENIERWARHVRYGLLEEMRLECGAELILTAHHANDQEETVLMRLVNGRAASGGLGILPSDPSRLLARPLLQLTRDELRRYAEHYNLGFVHDATNDDLNRTRNRIRAELVPELRRNYNPDLTTVLGELATRSLADEQYLEQLAASHTPQSGYRGERFSDIPVPLRWRALRRWIAASCGEQAARRVGYRALERLSECILEGEGRDRTIELGGGLCAHFSTREGLRLDREPAGAQQQPLVDELVSSFPYTLVRAYRDGSAVELSFAISDRTAGSAVEHTLPEPEAGVFREQFDADKIDIKSILVGERRPGETIHTIRGEQRIKKLLEGAALPLTLRDRVPIVRAGLWVLWIPGVARSMFATVDQNSMRLLDISCRRIT